MMNFKLSGLL